ncbi:hypothetical protein GE061_014136 [Apolygus lucorum]|uniref:26S proteasome non-ATPase regulatory subunit 4 n=1 Tax=Apolygus lucorum TaxID=248454 RepID=A0A8S9XQ02_APOLU|nr:hypothetical protein GE061_014136 [Apolygus lucorum]
MNITVLYDPRGARALFSMKYHYIPLLAILSKLYDYNLEIAAYPAQKFGYRYHGSTVESYVQNCVSLFEPNKTERLLILNCLTHCEFCMEIGLCQQGQSLYTPACIKHVKGDLRLLLKCELDKHNVISEVYHKWYVHWQKFHSHGTSANPVVLLLDGAQESLNIMDTGLVYRVCGHLNSSSDVFDRICGEFPKLREIQRMIEETPGGHIVVSDSRIGSQPLILNLLGCVKGMTTVNANSSKRVCSYSPTKRAPEEVTMVIECVVICMDNSEYMRNEDYLPSRLMAQCEAADFIVQAKLRSHPENQVALVTLSNHEVVAHLTSNQTKLLTEMYKVKIGGAVRFQQGLSVAQLILKHRLVKTHKCRIIAFVGSPVEVSEVEMQNMGKRFKKENVSVDVIRFGGEVAGSKEMEQLVSIVNGPSGGNNNFVFVLPGMNLTDTLVSSNVVGTVYRRETVHFADDDDDDLRAALEMSMRESGVPGTGASSGAQDFLPSAPCPTGIQDGNQLSDEEQLALAIQLSLQQAERDQQVTTLPNPQDDPVLVPQVEPILNNQQSVTLQDRQTPSPTTQPTGGTPPDLEDSPPLAGPKISPTKEEVPGQTKSSNHKDKKNSGASQGGKKDSNNNSKSGSPNK